MSEEETSKWTFFNGIFSSAEKKRAEQCKQCIVGAAWKKEAHLDRDLLPMVIIYGNTKRCAFILGNTSIFCLFSFANMQKQSANKNLTHVLHHMKNTYSTASNKTQTGRTARGTQKARRGMEMNVTHCKGRKLSDAFIETYQVQTNSYFNYFKCKQKLVLTWFVGGCESRGAKRRYYINYSNKEH